MKSHVASLQNDFQEVVGTKAIQLAENSTRDRDYEIEQVYTSHGELTKAAATVDYTGTYRLEDALPGNPKRFHALVVGLAHAVTSS